MEPDIIRLGRIPSGITGRTFAGLGAAAGDGRGGHLFTGTQETIAAWIGIPEIG